MQKKVKWIIFFLSIFFVVLGIGYCIHMHIQKQHEETNIPQIKIEVVKDYAKDLENQQGYENVTYEPSWLIELGKKYNLQYNSIDLGDSLDDIIIKKYDYKCNYYKVIIGKKELLFKTEKKAKKFLDKINKYDETKYEIEKTNFLVHNETKKETLNKIIKKKKKAYEEMLAKKKAEEARKRAEEAAAAAKKKIKNNKSSSKVTVSYSKSGLKGYAYNLVINKYGWTEYDFQCLVKLWNRESGWNPNAHNGYSGAHGIPQALPASKMASEGSDYYTNGETQIRWGLKYIKGKYGSPSNAWATSQARGWY